MERRKLTLTDWMAVTATTLGITIGITTTGAITYNVYNRLNNDVSNEQSNVEITTMPNYETTDTYSIEDQTMSTEQPYTYVRK